MLLPTKIISHSATNPTVFQSIAYLVSIADGTKFNSPPPSPLRQSPSRELVTVGSLDPAPS